MSTIFSFFEKASIQELKNGYKKQDDNTYMCGWCGNDFNNIVDVEAHVACKHPVNERFRILLGADAILKLTPETKALCTLLFKGEEQKEISKKIGLNYSSVRVKRSKLYYEEYLRSKLAFLLFDLIFSNQPKRPYNKKPKDALSNLSCIPYSSKNDSTIKDFASNKDKLHTDPDLAETVHYTVIILVAKRLSNGELFFLTCDKAHYNMDNPPEGVLSAQHRYDCLGGNVERQDMTNEDKYITDVTYRNCACRELKEELYLRKVKLNTDNLQHLFTRNYDNSDSITGRFNHEKSAVYLYILPEEADARIREEYIDSIGMTVKIELPIRYFTYQELLVQKNFCDGLGRVVSYFKDDPEIYKQLIRKT